MNTGNMRRTFTVKIIRQVRMKTESLLKEVVQDALNLRHPPLRSKLREMYKIHCITTVQLRLTNRGPSVSHELLEVGPKKRDQDRGAYANHLLHAVILLATP